MSRFPVPALVCLPSSLSIGAAARRLLVALLVGGAAIGGTGAARAQCGDCVAGPTRAQAGDVTAVGVQGLVEPEPAAGRLRPGFRIRPGTTINTPSAFGPGRRHVFVGVSYQHRIRYSAWRDGILVFGGGVGDPRRFVGVTAAVAVLDTYTDFGEDRSLSLKVHRRLFGRASVAVGYENVWHTPTTDGGSSRYAVASTLVPLRADRGAPLGSLVVNAGVGTGRFLSERQFARQASGINGFGSLALRLLRPVHGIANWSGQDLNVGLSVAPHRRLPVLLTVALLDVAGTAGDGARLAAGVSTGLAFGR